MYSTTATTAAAEVRWHMTQDAQNTWARVSDFSRAVQSTPQLNPIIARMDRVAEFGVYDTTESGLRRNRQGRVGADDMWCQVQSFQGDTLITFCCRERKHSRRVLVDAQGRVWIDCQDGYAVSKPTKYDEPVRRIMALRGLGD